MITILTYILGFFIGYFLSDYIFSIITINNWNHPLNGFTDYIYKGNQPFTLDPSCTELWHGSSKKLISVEDLYIDYCNYGKSMIEFEKHFK